MEVPELIKKSLNYFDKQNYKYKEYLAKNVKINIKEKKIVDLNDNKIIDIDYEVLGIFHHDSKVFFWGWVLPFLTNEETKISKELLNYGLSLDPQSNNIDHYYLKSLFVNSRIFIENDFNLDLIQSISSYLLKDKYNFIYPNTIYSKSENHFFITKYYLIKIN
jgi:hypothetical protein